MTAATDFESVYKQARRCLRRREYTEAIGLFQQAQGLDPDSADACEGLATVFFLAGEYEQAVDHFERLARLDPRRGRAHINLGAVLNRMGEHTKAVEALRKGLQRENKSSEGYYNLGIAYRGLGQLPMAVSAYREALRLAPEMSEAHLNLANIYVDMENVQQAISHYKTALEIRPEFERAARGLASAERAAEEVKQRFSPFGRLVEETPIETDNEPVAGRQLSDEQRVDDRKTVHKCAKRVIDKTQATVKQLRSEFEPALMALHRAISEADVPRFELEEAIDKFKNAFADFTELRRPLEDMLVELQTHEEQMSAPAENRE